MEGTDGMDIMRQCLHLEMKYLVWAWTAAINAWGIFNPSCLGYQGHGQNATVI